MNIASTALAAMIALSSAGFSNGQAATSTYTYNPNGEIFNTKYLPGPNQWPGECNVGGTEQTPVAIDSSAWPPLDTRDFNIGSYTFTVSW